jgi:hypothetical protein
VLLLYSSTSEATYCLPPNQCVPVTEEGIAMYLMIRSIEGSDDDEDGVTMTLYVDSACSLTVMVFFTPPLYDNIILRFLILYPIAINNIHGQNSRFLLQVLRRLVLRALQPLHLAPSLDT